MGISEAEAFSERLKRELLALEAANVHAILESEPLIQEVILPLFQILISSAFSFTYIMLASLIFLIFCVLLLNLL